MTIAVVTHGTPVATMGIRAGDIIAAIDNIAIVDAARLDNLLTERADREVSIRYLRGDESRLNPNQEQAIGHKDSLFITNIRYGVTACTTELRYGDLLIAVGDKTIRQPEDIGGWAERNGIGWPAMVDEQTSRFISGIEVLTDFYAFHAIRTTTHRKPWLAQEVPDSLHGERWIKILPSLLYEWHPAHNAVNIAGNTDVPGRCFEVREGAEVDLGYKREFLVSQQQDL